MIATCAHCHAENRIPFDKLDRQAKCGKCKQALPALAQPVAISNEAEFEALLRGAPWPVLVDFWAAWCGPCRAVAPELERLAGLRAGQLVVAKVDTELLPALAQRHGIRSLPTIVRFDRGRETQRTMGAQRAEQLAQSLSL
jgi:thioredoxin 2